MTNLTAHALAVLLPVGPDAPDRTVLIDGLAVRIWFDLEADLSEPGPRAAGWKWSINGEGPDVWYADYDLIYGYLADHWDAIVAEQAGVTHHAPEADLRAKLRAAEARIDALLTQVAEQQRKADAVYRLREADAERWYAERRALTAEANDLRQQRDSWLPRVDADAAVIRQIAAERDALKDVVASLHERAVRATEALGVVYDPTSRG
jgi:hypothetical protein